MYTWLKVLTCRRLPYALWWNENDAHAHQKNKVRMLLYAALHVDIPNYLNVALELPFSLPKRASTSEWRMPRISMLLINAIVINVYEIGQIDLIACNLISIWVSQWWNNLIIYNFGSNKEWARLCIAPISDKL